MEREKQPVTAKSLRVVAKRLRAEEARAIQTLVNTQTDDIRYCYARLFYFHDKFCARCGQNLLVTPGNITEDNPTAKGERHCYDCGPVDDTGRPLFERYLSKTEREGCH